MAFNILKNCGPKEIPMHSEFIFNAVTNENKHEYLEVLKLIEKAEEL